MEPEADAELGQSGGVSRADVVVVGGGMVGAALALALAKDGLRSIVCDPTPLSQAMAPGFDGRGYAISRAARRFLTHLGVWDEIASHAQPINDIVVSDGRIGERTSSWFLHFDHAELGPEGFGHMVEDHHLRRAVLAAAQTEPLVAYWDAAAMESWRRDAYGAEVTLSDGRVARGAMLAACDGRGSRLRDEAGIGRISLSYGQVGLVCAVSHEKLHHGVAHELFLPAGPFAILPLQGDRATLVWTERAEMAEALAAVDDAAYVAELRRRFGDFLGAVRLEGRRWTYPLSLSLAHEFIAPRLALVGDAGRGIHPIAGQGLNYGLRDAAALAETLGDAAGRGEDLGEVSVLRRYERWRRPDSLAIAAATHGFNALFSNDMAPVRWLRRAGLRAFGASGPLRRTAMGFAAGTSADLPASMRG